MDSSLECRYQSLFKVSLDSSESVPVSTSTKTAGSLARRPDRGVVGGAGAGTRGEGVGVEVADTFTMETLSEIVTVLGRRSSCDVTCEKPDWSNEWMLQLVRW